MVLGQFFCRFTGSAAQTHSARRPQLDSNKFLEEIFAGTNFRELAFDRENRENFCLAKISRYTVAGCSAMFRLMLCGQMCKGVISLQESHECLLNEILLLILQATVFTMIVAV